MADGNNNRPIANALNEFRLRLIGEPHNGARRPPTFGFSLRKNNPQLVVRTNVEGDKEYGKIQADLDTVDLFVLARDIERIATGPNGEKQVLKNLARKFMNGKMSDPMPDTFVLLGKDENGVVYIGIKSWDESRPMIKFVFRPSNQHAILDRNNQPLSAAELSVRYALGYVDTIRYIVAPVVVNGYVEPPPRDANGGGGGGQRGGGGGGWNNNGGGGNRGGGGNNWGGNSGGGGGSAGGGGGDDFPSSF